jgi:hypothetical protein
MGMEERNRAERDALACMSGVIQAMKESKGEVSTEYLAERFNDQIDEAGASELLKVE